MKIENIAPLQRGFDLPSQNIVNGNIPIVYSNGILKFHNEFKCKAPGLVTGRSGTIGKFTFLEEGEYWPHNTSLWVTNFFKNDPKFIYYLYHTINIENFSTGSGVPTLNRNDVHNKICSIPTTEEQQKISLFLSLLDERIQTQKKIIEKLKSQMSSLKDLLFEQQLKFKDSNGNNFPLWKYFRLSDLGNTFNGLSGKTKEHFGVGQKYIQYKQIFDSVKINIANCAFVDVKENENQNIVQYGDVFFTISSETPEEIGMSSVLLENVDNVYLNSFCFGFRTNSLDELIPEFSQFLFRSNKFRNEIVKLAQGSTRYNMSKTEFLKLKIKLPCKEEQTKIANFLSSIQEKIETEKQILEKLEFQKKFLLANLFI